MYTDRELILLKSSAPLCLLNDKDLPVLNGAGCLVDYCGQRILLTVEHTTGKPGRWALQLEFDKSGGTTLEVLDALNFLESVCLNTGQRKIIDFAYVGIPKELEAYRQEITDRQEIMASYPITVFDIDFDATPSKDDEFGFAGLVKGVLEQHPSLTFFASDLKIYDGLRFLRKDDDKYVFELPFDHPGHPEFKGCSGAPILNGEGKPVALLTGGCVKNNEIYGVSLNHHRASIDVFVMEI